MFQWTTNRLGTPLGQTSPQENVIYYYSHQDEIELNSSALRLIFFQVLVIQFKKMRRIYLKKYFDVQVSKNIKFYVSSEYYTKIRVEIPSFSSSSISKSSWILSLIFS